MDTQASSHDHPLVLNHNMHNRHELAFQLRCNKCRYPIVRGSFYSCFDCGYNLHYHCAVTMPSKINHPFHPQHPLSLCTIGSFTCAFCYPHYSNFQNPLRQEYYSYSCIECNLMLDIECALAPTITCYDDQTQPLCHLQPMVLVEKEDGLSFSACCVCESPSRFGSPTYYYYCKICEFSVHKSCTKFSRDIMHPFHPKHRLLLYFSYDILDCSSCGRDCCYRFNFRCKECDVNVCIRCTFLRPCIRYQGHDHLLCYVTYVWKFYARTSCDAQDAYCKQYSMGDLSEFNWSRNHVLRCVPCQFNLHLLCGPLPSVIKHKCHIHPLTLVDSLIEDDSGEYYCDSCEKKRDPRLCVYYCEGCKYVAHVQCVISEVLRVLKGELKDVELRIVGQNELDTEIMEKNLVLDKEKEENALVGEEDKASMTLMDLVSKLSKKELDDLHLVLVDYKTYSPSEKHQPVEVKDNIQEFINSLQNSNYSSRRFQLTADDLKVKIVNVGNYKVTHSLAHILKDLLAKYGDVSGGDESKLSTAMKSMAFYLLCGLIHSLRKTLLVDVTENHLQDWFLRLKILESNGFKIGFVRSCIERILPSYLVFEAERVIDEDKKRVDEKIAGLQKKIQGIVTEMEKCKKDHEKLCERYKKTTKFMEESESLISKYKIVGDDLF